MGIRDLVYIGKLMWNFYKNAKKLEALQAENVQLTAENARLVAANTALCNEHASEISALNVEHADALAALREEKKALLEQVDKWRGFEPYSPIPGTTVYRYVPPEGSSEAEHFACPHCRDVNDTKSILQFSDTSMRTAKCKECWAVYQFKPKQGFF